MPWAAPSNSSKVAANRVHYLSSSDIYEVPHLIASPLFGSYIRRNFDDLAGVSAHYGRVLAAGVGQNAFGTERLVRPGCRIQTIRPTSSLQKRDAAEGTVLEFDEKTRPTYISTTGGRDLPVEGVQFHPESILTGEGRTLLGNFLTTGI